MTGERPGLPARGGETAADSGSTPVPELLEDLRSLIEAARLRVAVGVNAEMVLLYWRMGTRIREEILGADRAAYGKEVMRTLAAELTAAYGAGFSHSNLARAVKVAEQFPDAGIVATLSQQLSWSHFVELIKLEDPLRREFYTEMCRLERWSVRALQAKVRGMLFERTALSRKPEELARRELAALRDGDRVTPDLVFRDPYLLDFLGLADTYSERDLEAAIVAELERFLLELGAGFSFVARQKRIAIDGEDYYIDLLFYHRRLRRLVAIDLKIDRFRAEHKGQMELYLRWLDRYEREAGEESPLGLILCAGKSEEHVELLRLEENGIRVAEYLTELPPRELLEARLAAAVRLARERYGDGAVAAGDGEEA